MSIQEIHEQLQQVRSFARTAYRLSLQAADLTEVRAVTLAQSTLAGSTHPAAEQVKAHLAAASDGLYAAFDHLNKAVAAIDDYCRTAL